MLMLALEGKNSKTQSLKFVQFKFFTRNHIDQHNVYAQQNILNKLQFI